MVLLELDYDMVWRLVFLLQHICMYHFTTRRYANLVYAIVMCLFVCPYVCHKSMFYQRG